MNRRTLLRSSTGVALSLPLLETMSVGKSIEKSPKRMVCIGVPFGFDPPVFIPTETGKSYQTTSHLKHLEEHREDMTIISGLSHPNTGGGGHKAEAVMFTGAPYPDYSHNLKNTISLDQEFASHFRGQTRYDSLVLSTFHGSLSVTANGVSIPSLNRPSQIYQKLFHATSQRQAEEEIQKIDQGRSILDLVTQEAKQLSQKVTTTDKQRIDEYFTSVREVERQLQFAREWVNQPKPEPIGKPPVDILDKTLQGKKLELMLSMIHLALMTDSTRSISIKTFGMHHDLSHHGKDPKKLAACQQEEIDLLVALNKFLTKLKGTSENSGNLLDQTMTVLTSNLRDGNTHWTYNLPVVLAGGGFKHGSHLAYNRPYIEKLAKDKTLTPDELKKQKNAKVIPHMGRDQQPLCNLFTSMLQNAGIEKPKFGSATGTLTGLEWKS